MKIDSLKSFKGDAEVGMRKSKSVRDVTNLIVASSTHSFHVAGS